MTPDEQEKMNAALARTAERLARAVEFAAEVCRRTSAALREYQRELTAIAPSATPAPVRNITVVMGDSFAADSPRYVARRIRKEMAS